MVWLGRLMSNQVQIYLGVSAALVGATALAISVPFPVVGLLGFALCQGMSRYNEQN